MLVVAVLLTALVAGGAWLFLSSAQGPVTAPPSVKEVVRGPYLHVVLEKGEVESANNVEVRCEIRARTGSGTSTSIVDLVPEGTWVKKGDWLITFDSSALEQQRRQQKIAVNSREAIMIQAKATYETAVMALTEYNEGTYPELDETLDNAISVAEQGLRKTELSYDSTRRMVARGALTMLQLEGEEFRRDAASNDLQLAQRKAVALEEYSKPKMLTQLQSAVKAAEVTYRTEKASYDEEVSKLDEIDGQIAKCRVCAPQDGQVVYANLVDHHGTAEFVVEAGAMVRERQVLFNLPDPTNMQIETEIAESRIHLVSEGMPASIRVEAMENRTLRGEVTKVNKYAEPSSFWSATTKQYGALVKVLDPPPELRVGLTAEVQIEVEQRDDALQIPVQSVYQHGGQTFCLIQRGRNWDTREVVISSTNGQTVAINEEQSEPLQPGELVVVNPRQHLDKFDARRFAD